jgi:hypothetical protein
MPAQQRELPLAPKYRTTADWQVAVTDAQTRVNGRHGTHVVVQDPLYPKTLQVVIQLPQ